MGLTKEELAELRAFKTVADDDNIRYKEIIKDMLINDRRIIHVLDNPSLNEDCPDEYIGKNILGHYRIPGTIAGVSNYICIETNASADPVRNGFIKVNQVIFHVMCDETNIIDKETSIERHDLLCALIKNIFNNQNVFGNKLRIATETPSVVDNNYATRTLVFNVEAPNSVVRTEHGITRVVNTLG